MLVDATDLGLVRVDIEPRFTGPQANQQSCKFVMAAARARLGGLIAPGSARVELVGGSPMLTIEGQPVLWFENWLRNREVRRGRV